MRRLSAVTAAAAALLVATTAVAGSGTTMTGTAVWTSQGTPETGLQSTSTAIEGTFKGPAGKGTYVGTLDGGAPFTTASCGPLCEAVTGSITFSTRHGDFTAAVQPGSVVALEDIASHSWRIFTLSLRIVAGTGSFQHADGTLALSYTSTWEHDVVNGVPINEITDSGSITGHLN